MGKKTASTAINQYVSFALGKEVFAIDVMKIKGVERLSEITAIPKYPDFIEGVINLRNEIIPIVDLRKRFGMAAAEPTKETRIVLVELDSFSVGLIVDRVFEVFQLLDNEIGHMPQISRSTVGSQFIKGVAEVRDRLIILLDLNSIFSEEEAQTLSGSVR